MRVREVGARVGRDQPELQRGARVEAVEAVEALRRQSGPEEMAQSVPVGTGGERFCRNCHQGVKPVVRRLWGKVALFVATAQLVAVIVSVVACFTAVAPWKGLRRWLVAWPAAIHPVGLGVVAAVLAALAAAWFADFLNERAERAASCPNCRSVPAAQTR